ncbi:MAG TPA: 2-C-methyl-D-erythritol 4-phosphate cytidylyltransferase [Deltaproteobacteria bacterium]|nr:2-C-methyl-D-erythritol 4-phosphate cytidylyltransferase [Deltaproteobacteria bacterium]
MPVMKSPKKTVAAIVPAAGSGVRMGAGRAKQFLEIRNRPLLALTLETLQKCDQVDAIILVVPEADVAFCRDQIVDPFGLNKVVKIIPGGVRRQDSVRIGVKATGGNYDLLLIHDGVRPMITVELVERVIDAAWTHRAVIAAMPAKETVKEVNSENEVVGTYDRKRVWMVQTPQIFRYGDIMAAHERAVSEGWEEATDDSLLVEKTGITVTVVEGSDRNIKVTTPFDLEMARNILGKNSE